MSPILGIYASQMSGHLTSFYSIATQTVGSGGASSITFSSIPSGYSHLQLRCILRSTYSGVDAMRMRFNSDSGSNYAFHALIGQGSSASAEGYASQPQIGYPQQANASLTTSIFGCNVVDILDYYNTSKYKTARILGGFDANGSGYLALHSGLWQNTNAITDLTLFLINGSFAQYSSFALYGIK